MLATTCKKPDNSVYKPLETHWYGFPYNLKSGISLIKGFSSERSTSRFPIILGGFGFGLGAYSLENYDLPRIPWDPPNRQATAATPSTSCRAHKHANTHGLSKALSHGELGGAWRSQKEPGARRSQGEPGAAKRSQERPDGTRESQEEPAGDMRSQEQQEEPRGARCSKKKPE